MNISSHPIWTSSSPTTKQKIPAYKKPFHIMRINLAKQYAKLFPRTMFIGITGSVGKTTTASAIALVLKQKYVTISTKPSLDSVLNIPETLLKIRPSVKKVVLEMGIEFKDEMDFYLSLVKPATAVITSIGYQHSEFLGDLDEIAMEKGKLVEQLPENGKAILNYDDINVRKMADNTKAEVIFYGKDSKKCQVWAGNIKIENFSTSFEINYGVERAQVTIPLLGEHQIYPSLAAAAVGLSEGISLVSIKNALEKQEPQEHRMNLRQGYNGSLVLDDTYNGSPLSIEAALDTIQKLPAKRRIIVLGETKELGPYSEKLHRKVAQRIYKDRVDLVLLGTGETKYIADELLALGFLPEALEVNLQNPQIVSRLLKVLSKGDICLIKGSRSLRLDEVVKRVVKKDV
jgi:UDP-N-acetylmuramoyl-tripeptide--D-alanyl-D-alanine ligase